MKNRIFIGILLLIVTLACKFATNIVGSEGPANFTAKLLSPDVVRLNWDAVEGATGYILELSIDNGDSFPIIALPPERTYYEDLTAPEMGNLTYQVQAVTESGPAGKSQVSIETGARQPHPYAVKPEYDEENAAAAVVGVQGGTLSLVDSNEVEYTLNIPEGALSADTEIRMTAVTAIQDWPLDGDSIGAVRLEPEGLVLNDVAILTIGFPVDIDPGLALVGYAFQADGQEFHLQPAYEQKGLTNNLPFAGGHLARPVFQKTKHVVRMPVVELTVGGVGQASGDSVSQYTKDHAPTDSGAALEQKRAAGAVADDELDSLQGLTDPVAKQAFLINQAISTAKNCNELNSQIVSFQKWRYDNIFRGMSDDQRRAVEKQIWDDLTDKVKEILEKAAADCEKSKEPGGAAAADSPCAKALLEKIMNPPNTITNFNWDLKNKLGNKLSDKELQDIKDKLEKCKKSYSVSGVSNDVSFSGQICSLDKPFSIDGTFPGGFARTLFTPSSVTGGVETMSGAGGGCTQRGSGSYTVAISDDGSGMITWTESATLTCPNINESRNLTFTLPLQPTTNIACP